MKQKTTIMKAIHLIVFVCLLASIQTTAQTKDENSKKHERVFKKFRVDVAGSGLRFTGKKDPGVEHSKTGYGFHLQPAWNITDNHSLGIKLAGSYHDEKNGTDHLSVLLNYTYTYFGRPGDIPDEMNKLFVVYGGVGCGISTSEVQNNDSTKNISDKTSFAIMPHLGIRYGRIFCDGHYHLAAGDKQNTYFSISFGVMFGGGFKKYSSSKN
jgi:hypothetical protein